MSDIELIEADLKSIDNARQCMESMKSIHRDRLLSQDFQIVWADLHGIACRLQKKLDRLKNERGAP